MTCPGQQLHAGPNASRLQNTPLLLAAFMAVMASSAGADTCDAGLARLTTAEGKIVDIAVELATDPASRAQGLMRREALEPEAGMLFVYPEPQRVAFWMRETLIPLDMLFFDAAGSLRHIHAEAIPHDETPIPGATSDDPAPERLLVLEIAGGEAARLGVTEGATLAHPAIDPDCDFPDVE